MFVLDVAVAACADSCRSTSHEVLRLWAMQGLRGASQDLKEHDAQELHSQRHGKLSGEHGLVVGEDALLVHGVGTSRHGAL